MDSPLETAQTILESTLEGTDDEDLRFKLRTSLQLLEVVEWKYEETEETLEEADLDESVKSNLQELGYLS